MKETGSTGRKMEEVLRYTLTGQDMMGDGKKVKIMDTAV